MKNISFFDGLRCRFSVDIPYYVRTLWLIVKSIENWYDVILKNEGQRIFRDKTVASHDEYWEMMWARHYGIEIDGDIYSLDYNGKRVFLAGKHGMILFPEVFIEEVYGSADVRGKIVVDIGANIGDTAVYFALKGAKHIYAFEPYPYCYGKALQNIEANKVKGRVSLARCAVGKKGRIRLSEQNGLGSNLKESEGGIPTDIITLKDIAERYPVKNSILKIDCEGYEYDIILEAEKEVLRQFSEIILEYHYGYLDIEKKLHEAGFETRHVVPIKKLYDAPSNSEMYIGLMHARRIC